MDKTLTIFVLIYLLIINIVGLIIMKVDKVKAIKHKWRIKESTLFLVSVIGGSIGTLAGMYLFRHKTKHWYFVIGMPFILICHVALFIYIKAAF